jgi:signal peptidase II
MRIPDGGRCLKKNRSERYLQILIIALVVIILDQASKLIVRANLAIRETWMPIEWLAPYFRIIHWKNTGVAFGLFPGMGWILTSIGLVVILLIILFYKPVIYGSKYWPIALGLQLGGAIGNLLDRINPQVGYVVDFIWIGNFPVFNLADVSIVVGAIVMMFGIWTEGESLENQPEDQPSESGIIENRSVAAETTEEDRADIPEIPWFEKK